ncbi:MAG: YraN family protein [Acetobacteraceae bacterium]
MIRCSSVQRTARGRRAAARGREAESLAAQALEREGWEILGRRVRTDAGEIDLLAQRAGFMSVVEVKARRSLADAAHSLSVRQQQRLFDATEIVLAEHPDWGTEGVRFDMIVVDAANTVRRIKDAFRGGMMA